MVEIRPTFPCKLRYPDLSHHCVREDMYSGLHPRRNGWKKRFLTKSNAQYFQDLLNPCMGWVLFWKVALQHVSLWTMLPCLQPSAYQVMLKQSLHRKPYYSCALNTNGSEILCYHRLFKPKPIQAGLHKQHLFYHSPNLNTTLHQLLSEGWHLKAPYYWKIRF